jgi:hypothetical protein
LHERDIRFIIPPPRSSGEPFPAVLPEGALTMPDADTPPVFQVGRIINWLVLTLLGASILYSLYIVVVNWKAITV